MSGQKTTRRDFVQKGVKTACGVLICPLIINMSGCNNNKSTKPAKRVSPDDKAPEQQIGFVLIQFKLGE